MGKKIVVGLLGLALALFAEFNRSSVLIDVPTAYVLRHKVIQGTAVGAFALSAYDSIPPPLRFRSLSGRRDRELPGDIPLSLQP